VEPVCGIENLGSLFTGLSRGQSGHDTADGGIAMDVVVLVFGKDPLDLPIGAYIFGIKGGTLKGDVKDFIGEIQLQAVFLGKIVAGGNVDLTVTVFPQHLYQRLMKLADMALYGGSQ
jgi:hypothetical protein